MAGGQPTLLFMILCTTTTTASTTGTLELDELTGLVDIKALSRIIASAPSGGMVSFPRREMTVRLALRAILDGVPGDFAETGLNTGGTAVLMLKVLKAYGGRRRFFGFDSFLGLPSRVEGDTASGSADTVADNIATRLQGDPGQMRTSRAVFEDNLKRNGVSDTHDAEKTRRRVHIFEGWFNETLPRATPHMRGGISFLRLDGDMFTSTWDGLLHLYPKLSVGGYIYIDDYGSFEGCRQAVDKYREQYSIADTMWPIYERMRQPQGRVEHRYEAVWWRKESHLGPNSLRK